MKILKSFIYAFAGLWYCITTQRNFRFHIVAAVSVIIAAQFYQFDRFEVICLSFAILFVLICEMINTAVESTVDMHGDEYNLNAKIAKDVAAGAVVLSAILAIIIAFTLFWDISKIIYIWDFFVQYPLLWVALGVYTVVCICFVVGLPFRKYNR